MNDFAMQNDRPSMPY